MSGQVGRTGAIVQCRAVAEPHQEVVTVYRNQLTVIHVWDLRGKCMGVLDINAQVSTTLSVSLKKLIFRIVQANCVSSQDNIKYFSCMLLP